MISSLKLESIFRISESYKYCPDDVDFYNNKWNRTIDTNIVVAQCSDNYAGILRILHINYMVSNIILFVAERELELNYFLLDVFHYGRWRIGCGFPPLHRIEVVIRKFYFNIIFLFVAYIYLYLLIDRTLNKLFQFR